ncbi:anti-sigma factor family protein [Sphingopyxis yananensis]|uniref:anti-sigma factor family protein n=1 Tax=Sphingopyxis yananensis TaxID=2886687 RepID=UPI001D1201F8|nr:anti-sigma factor [Sphingopyxis yananensis]MCC2603178.1 anti-sigma factor [Sphingopyxis yananensis]
MSTDNLEDFEILAYVDGELDLPRRLAVEDYLARNPTAAARVMADFRSRSALQILTKSRAEYSPSLGTSVAKLVKHRPAMPWRRAALGIGVAAMLAITAIVVPIWHVQSSPPTYIEMAAETHRAHKERAAFAALHPFSYKDHTLLMASRIAVPRLPDDWRIKNIEMLDATDSPSILIAVETSEGDDLSILAIRARSSAPMSPDAVRSGNKSVAYWRRGDFSYALTGNGNPEHIDAVADALAESW